MLIISVGTGTSAGENFSLRPEQMNLLFNASAIPSALKVAKPGSEAFRSALRDAIEQERDVIGCQGVFNMSPTNHNGMDERARVLVTVKDGRFRLLPE